MHGRYSCGRVLNSYILAGSDQYWMLAALPPGLGLFEQITQKKESQTLVVQPGQPDKLRLDRFIWGRYSEGPLSFPPLGLLLTAPTFAGTGGRKIRSAISLGKHISHHLHQRFSSVCPCDGCKSLAPPPGPPPTAEELAYLELNKDAIAKDKEAKNHRKKPPLIVEGPENRPVPPIERPKREIGKRKAGSDTSSSDGRIKSPGETRTLYRRTVRWEPEPPEGVAVDALVDEVPVSTPPIRTDEEKMEVLERIEVDEDPDAVLEAHLDQVHISDCRRGELVWVAGSCVKGRGSEFGRWPGIVKSRRFEVSTTSSKVNPRSSLYYLDNPALTSMYPGDATVLRDRTSRQEHHRRDARRHSLPCLHSPRPRSNGSQDVRGAEGRQACDHEPGGEEDDGRVEGNSTSGGRHRRVPRGVPHRWLVRHDPEPTVSSHPDSFPFLRPDRLRLHRLPTLEIGPHLLLHPKRNKKGRSNRQRVVSSKSTTDNIEFSQQYFAYDKLWYGAEVLRLGDVVRLHPFIELPPCAVRQCTPPNEAVLSMTLCLRVFEFYRAATTNSALFARGQLFEMVEVGPNYVEDAESLDRRPRSEAVDQMTERQAIAALPLPFPLHRWRRVNVDGYYVDVFSSGIAGRYYAVDSKLRSETTVEDVNKIVQGANETGVVGYDGFWPLSLMLGGLATAGNVPALTVSPSLRPSRRL